MTILYIQIFNHSIILTLIMLYKLLYIIGMLHYTLNVESKKKDSWKDDNTLLSTHLMLSTIQYTIDAESRV